MTRPHVSFAVSVAMVVLFVWTAIQVATADPPLQTEAIFFEGRLIPAPAWYFRLSASPIWLWGVPAVGLLAAVYAYLTRARGLAIAVAIVLTLTSIATAFLDELW